MIDKELFGNRVRMMRKRLGLNQGELAEMVGVTRSAVNSYECGKRLTEMNTLVELSKALNCSVAFLLGEISVESPEHPGISYGTLTLQQHLMVCLFEECSEVTQAVGKILRFGEDNFHPATPGITNLDDLESELADLFAVVRMLQEYGYINGINKDAMERKKQKVKNYMAESREWGMLEPDWRKHNEKPSK